MLDIKYIRENSEEVKVAAKNKKSKVDVDALLQLDEQRRKLQTTVENLNQEKNIAAKDKDIERGKLVKDNLIALEEELKEINEKYQQIMLTVPNVYSSDTPIGMEEQENIVIRDNGELPKFTFEPKEHWQLGKDLDILDIETASEVTGARFAYLKGGLALLEFALVQLVMKTLTDEKTLKEIIEKAGLNISSKPFVPVVPPVFIKPDVMQRMGRLEPRDERYYIPSDDLYLIGSAEHTLGPIHMDQAIPEHKLPIRYIGFSTSFRREAGSYGKDTKGIIRVHQFDKLEMESFSTPETGLDEQNFFVAIQEYLLQQLELPYQVMQICTGDMGGPDFRQIDINTWMPGQGKYRETSTSDYMTDYQARRLNIKVKRENGKNDLVHMNDATAFAISRTLVAIMENYQQEDGSIKIPKALQPFMFGQEEITK